MRTNDWTRRFALVLVAFVLVFAGCSEDDNPAGSNDEEENHLEAVGVRVLDADGTVLVEADGTEVSGEIHIHEGESTDFLTVLFLDPDTGDWYDPEDREGEHEEGEEHHHELVVTATDGEIVSATMADDIPDAATEWGFVLDGLEHGETTIRVQIYHEDHPDYTSPQLPVHVEHEEDITTVGVALVMEGNDLVVVNGSSTTGQLTVAAGGTLGPVEVFWLDPDGERIQPDDPDFVLAVESDGESIATATLGEGWQFTVNGGTAGTTTFHVGIEHDGHFHGNYVIPVVTE